MSNDTTREGTFIFPAEIWLEICSHLPISSISSLNLTNKAFRALSTSVLYRKIPTIAIDASRTLCETLLQKPNLVRHIRQLTLQGARLTENESVHAYAIKLLSLSVLQQNLESFEFVYTSETHDGWSESEDLLKDNIIWETIERGKYPRLEELSVREFPYGSAENENSLFKLTHWKRVAVTTQEFQLDNADGEPDVDPYTIGLFSWLIDNRSLTRLDLQLRLDDGPATVDSCSVTSLLDGASWPELISLSISGGECHNMRDDGITDYGSSESLHKFLESHPGIGYLNIGVCPGNDFRGRQTIPFTSLPSGILPNLRYFAGVRNHVEDLAHMYGRHGKLQHLVLNADFDGMGWDDEDHPPRLTFAKALEAFPNLLSLELELGYGTNLSKDIDFFKPMLDLCSRLRTIIVRDFYVGDELQGFAGVKDRVDGVAEFQDDDTGLYGVVISLKTVD
ncbi:hypothetical protein BT69DRAFT_1352700 [Atractiella rhizophila]|nr:hypothetical protein BT69DRAFT_1352700 [Atractiella rhizophila]